MASPILSNIMLDDLDRELWERGHRFVRYADDLRVFVRSERAAQRVFDGVCGVIERRLRLKVNREMSSIRHAAEATLLGFGLSLSGPQVTILAAPKAVRRLKDQLRTLTRRNWGVSMAYRIGAINRFTTGWMAYFRLADTGNWSGRWIGGCAAVCGRSAGRNGRPPPPGGTICACEVSPSATSANGAAAARDTGGLRAPRSSAWPCPTPTGITSA
ncbi:MAG: group II intron maturase-specific domain-containing protein [Micromonosporaceae bacterium]